MATRGPAGRPGGGQPLDRWLRRPVRPDGRAASRSPTTRPTSSSSTNRPTAGSTGRCSPTAGPTRRSRPTTASRPPASLKVKATGDELTPELEKARIPLNAWGSVGRETTATEDYAYAASLTLARAIAERAGADGLLKAVWADASTRVGAYQPPAGAAGRAVDGPPDWRGLLDLLEDADRQVVRRPVADVGRPARGPAAARRARGRADRATTRWSRRPATGGCRRRSGTRSGRGSSRTPPRCSISRATCSTSGPPSSRPPPPRAARPPTRCGPRSRAMTGSTTRSRRPTPSSRRSSATRRPSRCDPAGSDLFVTLGLWDEDAGGRPGRGARRIRARRPVRRRRVRRRGCRDMVRRRGTRTGPGHQPAGPRSLGPDQPGPDHGLVARPAPPSAASDARPPDEDVGQAVTVPRTARAGWQGGPGEPYATLAATSEPVSPAHGHDARERGADPD